MLGWRKRVVLLLRKLDRFFFRSISMSEHEMNSLSTSFFGELDGLLGGWVNGIESHGWWCRYSLSGVEVRVILEFVSSQVDIRIGERGDSYSIEEVSGILRGDSVGDGLSPNILFVRDVRGSAKEVAHLISAYCMPAIRDWNNMSPLLRERRAVAVSEEQAEYGPSGEMPSDPW